MAENEFEVVFSGDISDLVRDVSKGAGAIKDFANNVNEAASDAASGFARIRDSVKFGNAPLQDLRKLDAELRTIKNTLASGFTPAINKINLSQPTNSVHTFSEQIRIAQGYLDRLNATAVKTGSSVSKLKPGSDQATFALQNLSRVAQDAPFGLIGIANNIEPLIVSFQSLKREAGTGATVFKLLMSSLAGPGGLLLGVGLASAAMSLFGMATRGANKEAKELKDTTKGVVSELAGEASRVSELVTALRSNTLSAKERNGALQELGRINPQYFGQLKDEKGLIENLTGSYNAYIQNLSKIASSRVFEKKLQEAFERKIDLELKIDPDRPENFVNLGKKDADSYKEAFITAYNLKPSVPDSIASNLQNGAKWDRYGNLIGGEIKKGIQRVGTFIDNPKFNKQLAEANSDVAFFIKKIQDIGQIKVSPVDPKKDNKQGKTWAEIFADIQHDQEKLWGDLFEFSDKQSDKYFSDWEKSIKASDRRQAMIDAFAGTNDAIKKGIVGIAARGGTDDILSGASLDAFNAQRIEDFNKLFRSIGQNPPDVSWVDDLGAKATLLNAKWLEVSKQFHVTADMLTSFLQPAFSSLFDTLLSGSVSAAQALRNFFVGLIKQIVATIAQAAALAAILSAFGFGGGGGFTGLFKKFLGFGNSGGGSPFSGGAGPSGLALAGAATGSAGGMNELNFRLDGNDLVASINRTNQSNGRMGG